jgi:hypothetical protein
MEEEPTLTDFFAGVCLFTIAVVTWGYTTAEVRKWHVSPLFGVKSITFLESLGLRTAAFMFLYRPDTKSEKAFNELTVESIFSAVIMWGFGWLWYYLRVG